MFFVDFQDVFVGDFCDDFYVFCQGNKNEFLFVQLDGDCIEDFIDENVVDIDEQLGQYCLIVL